MKQINIDFLRSFLDESEISSLRAKDVFPITQENDFVLKSKEFSDYHAAEQANAVWNEDGELVKFFCFELRQFKTRLEAIYLHYEVAYMCPERITFDKRHREVNRQGEGFSLNVTYHWAVGLMHVAIDNVYDVNVGGPHDIQCKEHCTYDHLNRLISLTVSTESDERMAFQYNGIATTPVTVTFEDGEVLAM